MKPIQCTLCLGSNTEAERNIEKARFLLTAILPDIHWEEAKWTEPINFPNPNLFLNQMATFTTSLRCEELHLHFKEIEQRCGRRYEDKQQGIVRIDIDLLSYGDKVIKEVPFY